MVYSRRFLPAAVLSFVLAGPAWTADGVEGLIRQGADQAGAGQLDAALATLQRAVTTDPGSSLAYTRLGGVQILKQSYSAGIRSFQQAVMLDRSNANAFVGMGVAYLHLGQYSLAREALGEAEKLDPSKQAEIGRVRAWIDARSMGSPH